MWVTCFYYSFFFFERISNSFAALSAFQGSCLLLYSAIGDMLQKRIEDK